MVIFSFKKNPTDLIGCSFKISLQKLDDLAGKLPEIVEKAVVKELNGDTEQKLTKGKFLYIHNSEYKMPQAIY